MKMYRVYNKNGQYIGGVYGFDAASALERAKLMYPDACRVEETDEQK